MKRGLLVAGAILAALGVLGALVAVLGLVPIAASSGHWAITEAVLELGMRRSVAAHAPEIDPSTLAEPWLVAKGAAHYETACRPCHGSPDQRGSRIAKAMLPPPPYLGTRVSEWDPGELFYITKHGLYPAQPGEK